MHLCLALAGSHTSELYRDILPQAKRLLAMILPINIQKKITNLFFEKFYKDFFEETI